jgi:PKD repeat protein
LCAGSNSQIIASEYTVPATNLTASGIQLAPDGKIYVARYTQNTIGVIHNPNVTGSGMNYVNAGQSLGTGTCNYALPAFVARPLKSPPFTSSTQCQQVNFNNTAATSTAINNCSFATFSLVSCLWNFGDPASAASNTSTALNPMHLYSGIGTFTATLILNYKCFNDTLKQMVNITALSPTFAVSGPTAICKGETVLFTASSSTNVAYSWSNGQTTNSISATPTANANYTVTCSAGGCISSKAISLIVNKCTSIGKTGDRLENVAIYPNPASQLLIIESESYDDLVVTVRNQLGEIIFLKDLTSLKEEIHVDTWNKGMYFLTVSRNGVGSTKKLLLE